MRYISLRRAYGFTVSTVGPVGGGLGALYLTRGSSGHWDGRGRTHQQGKDANREAGIAWEQRQTCFLEIS